MSENEQENVINNTSFAGFSRINPMMTMVAPVLIFQQQFMIASCKMFLRSCNVNTSNQ